MRARPILLASILLTAACAATAPAPPPVSKSAPPPVLPSSDRERQRSLLDGFRLELGSLLDREEAGVPDAAGPTAVPDSVLLDVPQWEWWNSWERLRRRVDRALGQEPFEAPTFTDPDVRRAFLEEVVAPFREAYAEHRARTGRDWWR